MKKFEVSSDFVAGVLLLLQDINYLLDTYCIDDEDIYETVEHTKQLLNQDIKEL